MLLTFTGRHSSLSNQLFPTASPLTALTMKAGKLYLLSLPLSSQRGHVTRSQPIRCKQKSVPGESGGGGLWFNGLIFSLSL